jgi:hypothetical protein
VFAEPTIFLLGAGASWHYGYPTGEELVKKVIQKAGYLQKYLEFSAQTNYDLVPAYVANTGAAETPIKQRWHAALNDCIALKTRLEQVNPLVIDYFLGWNPMLQSVGRLLIAWVILECEHLFAQNHGNINRREALLNSPLEPDRIRANNISLQKYKDNWCRYLIHQIAVHCKASSDIHNNNVRFVTFNYDLSLERALGYGLTHLELFQRQDVEQFLNDNRIMHVYGKVRESPFIAPSTLNWPEQGRDPKNMGSGQFQHLHNYKNFLDEIYSASRGIRVIDPDDKDADQPLVHSAASAIDNARYVYILGYGFDENNSSRLGLRKALGHNRLKAPSVFFTNFGNMNKINKRASKLFFGNSEHFSPTAHQVDSFTGGLHSYYYERSYRDVYEALELDFDLPPS